MTILPFRNFASDVAQPTARVTPADERNADAGLMTDVVFKLTINQLCAVIRQRGIDGEANTMLSVLESLVVAGEIAFPDFMGRVQNLFPDVFDQIDPTLLNKLTSFIND